MRVMLWCLTVLAAVRLAAAGPVWIINADGKDAQITAPAPDGIVSANFSFPGSGQIYLEQERKTFRPAPADFTRRELVIDARLKKGLPVRGTLFVKDKDGYWFRSDREFTLSEGDFQTYRVRLDQPGRNLIPVGHAASWSADYAVGIFAAGLSVFSDQKGEAEIECRNLRYEGEREIPSLAVRDWQLPATGEKFKQLESRFQLTREYFNPFDPELIAVDFEFKTPDGEIRRYPAFYGRDFQRKKLLAREIVSPVGAPYWAFRFTPPAAGDYELRIVIDDRTPGHQAKYESPWRKVKVGDNQERGFVRVSPKHPSFFEFSNGEFFYPVTLNIHTNIDLRSEYRFELGHLPDLGTYDYDMYFEACGKAGITVAEVWMASWTCALEWDSAREFYHGVGRYNLANAWKLDTILDAAGRNNLYLNLVLDNHGKTAMDTDQEWNDNPYNSNAEFAAANGGFLPDAGLFFVDETAIKYDAKRARYLAARWGADPRVMVVELWSEVDLVSGFKDRYAEGAAAKWHADAAARYRKQSQARHLVTTHVCGDWRRNLDYRDIFEVPEITHWAGDAYRNINIHIVDQMRAQEANMRFDKPVWITEFGGSSLGGDGGLILGDIHGGIWSSFFKRQAGTPFLWWHDFVHMFNHYQHYRGFADFIAGVDLRDWTLTIGEPEPVIFAPASPPSVSFDGPIDAEKSRTAELSLWRRPYLAPRLFPENPENRIEALSIGSRDRVYGWAFVRSAMYSYPNQAEMYPEIRRAAVKLDYPLEPGRYRIRFYDPLSGKVLLEDTVRHAGGRMTLPLYPFRLDIAFKVEKTGDSAE